MNKSMNPSLPSPADEPTISELDGIRYLHFSTEWVQGAMRIKNPSELVLAYARQMMAWLLFLAPGKEDTIGILGLGAGSLVRFALKHTRGSVVTVEWNARVIAVCRAYFRLSKSVRSIVDQCDAAVWVQQSDNADRFCALMVDIYDAYARGPVHESLEFYQGCYRSLNDTGVMTVNLFGDHESFPRNLANIRAVFDGGVLELPEVDVGNRVILAFKGPLLQIGAPQFMDRARLVESRYGLPAIRWAKSLLRQRDFRDRSRNA